MPAMRNLASPAVVLLNMFVVLVNRDKHLLFNLNVLNNRYWDMFHDRYRDVLINRHFLDHRDFLHNVDRYRHLGDVMMMHGMDLVRHVDSDMLAEMRKKCFYPYKKSETKQKCKEGKTNSIPRV